MCSWLILKSLILICWIVVSQGWEASVKYKTKQREPNPSVSARFKVLGRNLSHGAWKLWDQTHLHPYHIDSFLRLWNYSTVACSWNFTSTYLALSCSQSRFYSTLNTIASLLTARCSNFEERAFWQLFISFSSICIYLFCWALDHHVLCNLLLLVFYPKWRLSCIHSIIGLVFIS